jgi:hypothetical protein
LNNLKCTSCLNKWKRQKRTLQIGIIRDGVFVCPCNTKTIFNDFLGSKIICSFLLTPKILWNQKLIDCYLGSLCEEKIISFQTFLLYKWTTYFTSFPGTPSTSNSNFIWVRGKVLFKTGNKFISHVFVEELLYATMWLKLPKGWRAWC